VVFLLVPEGLRGEAQLAERAHKSSLPARAAAQSRRCCAAKSHAGVAMAAAVFHPGKGGDVCRIRGRGFVAHSGQGLATAIMAQALGEWDGWGPGRVKWESDCLGRGRS
jgi:hypothetical protein